MTPVLSSVLTGMPAFYPMLPIMICELLIYGLVSGLLYQRGRMKLLPSLLIGMVLGRAAHGAVFALLMLSGGKPVTFASATAFIGEGIPGTLLQLVLVPVIVKGLERLMHKASAAGTYTGEEVFKKAKDLIASGDYSFIIIKDDKIAYKDSGRGVKPIMKVIDNDRELLKDAVIVDKIIGKAAALLLDLGGVNSVYGELMSRPAQEYLKSRGIMTDCGRCIHVISNRTGDGICPLERSVSEVNDPEAAYGILKETIAELMKAAM